MFSNLLPMTFFHILPSQSHQTGFLDHQLQGIRVSLVAQTVICLHEGDLASTPRSGRSPGGGHGSLLQYSCLENPHEQWSLASCSEWGRKEPDRNEQLNTICRLHRMILKFFQIHGRCCTNIKHKLINNNYIL